MKIARNAVHAVTGGVIIRSPHTPLLRWLGLLAMIGLGPAAAIGQNPSPVPPQLASYNRAADPHPFTVFHQEGGWCWYQDPRSIVSGDHLFIGAVQGNGSGAALVGVYDLARNQRLGSVVLRDHFDHDDHNSPVFHARPDGSVLAVYARHGRDFRHHYRISDPHNPLEWTEEKVFTHDHPGAGKITYMNLIDMSSENLLYNFYRGIEFNPSLIVSRDQGSTWETPTHFIASELEGRHRPYARYAGNGTDSVHVSFTDGHPRNFGNSIYYTVFRDGNFHRADGTVIKNLAKDGPLRPSESERVYQGTGNPDRGHGLSAVGAAWTSSMALDQDGHPHIGYTLYHANDDNRYRLASWDGRAWIDREVAYAGNCLYEQEASYTGLITTDPVDPTVVFISTDVNPSTGEFTGGRHEIYRAWITADDDIHSIVWHPVTRNSPVRNLRPMVLRTDEKRIVLWNRGDFVTYTDYQLDTVGLIEDVSID